jgi:hypothetical protein
MKQTAVEWLLYKLEIFATEEEMNIIEQAKEMEKEQIIEAYCMGDDNIGAEQYYNETFKSNQ